MGIMDTGTISMVTTSMAARQWRWHRDWRPWVAVILMLAAMVGYVLSDDESLRPASRGSNRMPAAP